MVRHHLAGSHQVGRLVALDGRLLAGLESVHLLLCLAGWARAQVLVQVGLALRAHPGLGDHRVENGGELVVGRLRLLLGVQQVLAGLLSVLLLTVELLSLA